MRVGSAWWERQGSRTSLTASLSFVDEGHEEPGWRDFVTSEELHAIWDLDLIRLMARSPDAFSPTFTSAVRSNGEIVGIFVGAYRGFRPHSRPGRAEPVLIDMRMPGHAHAPSWRLRSGLTADQRRAVIAEFESALLRVFGRIRLTGICYRAVTGADLRTLRRTGLLTRPAHPPGVSLRLPATVQEYLSGLTKGRRKSLRKTARRLEQQLRIRFDNNRTDLDPVAVAALNDDVCARHRRSKLDPRPRVPADYYRALMAREDVQTLSYHRGDELVAVGMLLRHRRNPWGSFWGMRHPSDGGVPHLYFDHFLRYVRHCIEVDGAEVLTSGRGLLEDKRSVGFRPDPMGVALVGRPFLAGTR